jgi:hypothetical protein
MAGSKLKCPVRNCVSASESQACSRTDSKYWVPRVAVAAKKVGFTGRGQGPSSRRTTSNVEVDVNSDQRGRKRIGQVGGGLNLMKVAETSRVVLSLEGQKYRTLNLDRSVAYDPLPSWTREVCIRNSPTRRSRYEESRWRRGRMVGLESRMGSLGWAIWRVRPTLSEPHSLIWCITFHVRYLENVLPDLIKPSHFLTIITE